MNPVEIAFFRVRYAVLNAADVERIQMRIGPAHYRLEHQMQPMQSNVAGDLKSSPDRRVAFPERHLELINYLVCFFGHDLNPRNLDKDGWFNYFAVQRGSIRSHPILLSP